MCKVSIFVQRQTAWTRCLRITWIIFLVVVVISWQSSCFQHQRSAVRIQTLAKIILNIVYCQLYLKNENKEKEAGNGPLKNRDKFLLNGTRRLSANEELGLFASECKSSVTRDQYYKGDFAVTQLTATFRCII